MSLDLLHTRVLLPDPVRLYFVTWSHCSKGCARFALRPQAKPVAILTILLHKLTSCIPWQISHGSLSTNTQWFYPVPHHTTSCSSTSICLRSDSPKAETNVRRVCRDQSIPLREQSLGIQYLCWMHNITRNSKTILSDSLSKDALGSFRKRAHKYFS